MHTKITEINIIPKVTISCPQCNTIKLIRYLPEYVPDNFEGCWACDVSSKVIEWEIVQVIN